MAVVIESTTSQVSYTAVTDLGSTGSFNVTKPSGLSVGDMLIAIVSISNTGGTITPPSGWTSLSLDYSNDNMITAGYYKLADSGDVAASNFTFLTASDTVEYMYFCYRLTGTATSGNPVQYKVYDTQSITDSTEITDTIDLLQTSGSLLIAITNLVTSVGTYGMDSFVLTGVTATFTERIDEDSNDRVFFLSDAISTSDGSATAYTLTLTGEETETFYTNILAILPQQDASEELTLTTVGNTAFAPSVSAGAKASPTLKTTNNIKFDTIGVGTKETVWTNETQPSTDWTNDI